MIHRCLFRVLLFLSASMAMPVFAQTFECAFLQDKYASGKTNKASCSMLPEKVYSTKGYTPKKNEHCDIDKVYLYEDIEDVVIDSKSGLISWTKHRGLTEDAKPKHKKYLIKKGHSEKEAVKRVNFENRQQESFIIKTHQTSKQRIFIDGVTGKILDPPKEVPEHNFIFTDGRSIFYMYIPESSGHAILMEPRGDAETSWVGMRFGKCRIRK